MARASLTLAWMKSNRTNKPLLGLDQRGVLADALRQGPQDPHDLSALIVPQHLQLVVDLMAVCGFDEGHRARLGCAQGTCPAPSVLWVLAMAKTRRSFR